MAIKNLADPNLRGRHDRLQQPPAGQSVSRGPPPAQVAGDHLRVVCSASSGNFLASANLRNEAELHT